MAKAFTSILGRRTSLDPGEANAERIAGLRGADMAAANFADRLPFSFDSGVSQPATVVAGPAAATGKGIDGHAASNEILVFGCGCGCGSKDGMVHDSLGVDVQAPVSIADEGQLTVEVGGSVSGVIDDETDIDFINVDVVAGQTYLVSMRGAGDEPHPDTFLEIFAPGAVAVNADDDGGNVFNSLITFTAAVTGTYSIEASGMNQLTGGWTVDVRQEAADESTNIGDADAVALADQTFGFLQVGDLTDSGSSTIGDYYAVTLEAGKTYDFSVAAGADYETDFLAVPPGESDTRILIRNAGGSILTANDDVSFPDDISSSVRYTATADGTFYIQVNGYTGPAVSAGYILEVNEYIPPDPAGFDPLDSLDWFNAANIPTVDVGGVPTAYVYFGAAGENFGETADDGVSPMVTYGWNQKEMDAVMLALEEYTKILGIEYVITTDVNLAATNGFRLSTTTSQQYGAYMYPQDPAFGDARGIGVFNVNSGGWDKLGVSTQDLPGDQLSLDQGGFSFSTILHEFGHAHGVAHPHDNGGGSEIMLGVTAATGSYGLFDLNEGVHTVMSYNDAWDFHPDGGSPFTISGIGNGWTGTLSPFDIAILERRYGTDTPHEAGDNVYTLIDVQADAFYQAIYDTAGTDSIEYSGSSRAVIDLTAATLDYTPSGGGMLSYVNLNADPAAADGIWGGFTIANGVFIENASSGSGDDALFGNDIANILSGNGGADLISGAGGDDTLIGGRGTDTLDGGDGFDTVDYSAATGNMAINLGTNKASGSDGRDDLANIEGVLGSAQSDLITGGTDNNRLSGRGGDDVIDGRAGNDIITGGSGLDLFIFGEGWGYDRLVGFVENDAEKIDLSGVSGIRDFDDLLTSHLRSNANGNAEIFDGENVIQLVGITTAEFGDGLGYSANDFIFQIPPDTEVRPDILI